MLPSRKKHKNLMHYRQREVMLAMGYLPLSGNLTPQYYIEDEVNYETVDPDSIEDMIEFTTSEELCEEEEFKKTMSDALDSLTTKEAKVLRLRFGIGTDNELTLEQIANIFNVTRERIRQIEAKALRKMRHPSKSVMYQGYINPDVPFGSFNAAIKELPPQMEDYDDYGLEAIKYYGEALFSWRKRVDLAIKRFTEVKSKIRGLV
jgi:RNA polymerase sigma factor (sigma-70 family)